MNTNLLYCHECDLSGQFSVRGNLVRPVCGIGPSTCELCILGRNPGEDENVRGEPFVGKAGKRLDIMIEKLGYERDSCYITNIVKCYTKGNAAPKKPIISTCTSRWLLNELAEVSMKYLLVLGSEAKSWFGGNSSFVQWPSSLRIAFFSLHPSAALRKPIFEAILRSQTRTMKHLITEDKASSEQQPIQLIALR